MSDTQKDTKPNVPNLRFPGFEGEWESFALGQLCEEFQSGKGIKSDQIKDLGSYPVYGGNGLRGYTDSYNHEGVYTLIGRQGAKCGNVRLVSGRTYITEHAVAVKANQANVTEFLNWLFIKMDLGQYSDQSAQPGLAVNKLVRLNAFVPKKEEQKRIADLMTLIDARIAIQNKVIEDLNKLKIALENRLVDQSHGKPVPLGDILIERVEKSKERNQY
ncbi:MAG: restriction endonuclease subunit S, partial [Bacteroidales bacterium]|nr:restriction endonuclease subunit S [Bacteroidales bacterium]